MSKIFTLTGTFGCGKTATALSFVPLDMPKGKTPERLIIDPEMRFDTYESPDGQDHPEKLQFAFKHLGTPRVVPKDVILLWRGIHEGTYKPMPDVVIVDDTAMFQDLMIGHWRSSQIALKDTATIYGMDKEGPCMANSYKPYDAGTIFFMKRLFIAWMQDLKEKNITLILTSPLHNVWINYGQKGQAEDGLPKMRVVGKSAKVLDCWQQMTDVIWFLIRTDPKGKLTPLPRVVMDNFIAKAALPGIPEQFNWPGWETLWNWHKERKFMADVTKLAGPESEYTPEMIEAMINTDKKALVQELANEVTIEEIKEAMSSELAPEYTVDKDYKLDEAHKKAKAWILRWVKEHRPLPESAQPEEPKE
jgi:hypothetical protein